jgi:hypothetical protein
MDAGNERKMAVGSPLRIKRMRATELRWVKIAGRIETLH